MAANQKYYHGHTCGISLIAVLSALFLFVVAPHASAQLHGAWMKELTPPPAVPFPAIRAFTATYHFGWANIFEAGKADVEFKYPQPDEYFISAKGGTIGIVSTLWKMSAAHQAGGATGGFFPAWMMQQEKYSKKSVDMKAYFLPDFTWSLRDVAPSTDPHKWRKMPVPYLRDMTSAMLFVRSQPLKIGDQVKLTVFPGDSAYFVTVDVIRRDTIPLHGKQVNTLLLTLDIKQINLHGKDKGSLHPHSKFHKGTIWVSDDTDRIPLRAEVDIFVGYVYGQLDSIKFQ